MAFLNIHQECDLQRRFTWVIEVQLNASTDPQAREAIRQLGTALNVLDEIETWNFTEITPDYRVTVDASFNPSDEHQTNLVFERMAEMLDTSTAIDHWEFRRIICGSRYC